MKRILMALMLATPCSVSFSQQQILPEKSGARIPSSLLKTLGSPRYQILNVNTFSSWMRSDGLSNHSPTNDVGARYPRFTGGVIYQDGILWGGRAYLDAAKTTPVTFRSLRVGGNQYQSGTRAGWIEGFDASATRADTSRADVRLYRIRRDWASMDEFNLVRDAAETFEISQSSVTRSLMDQVLSQYEKDWREWPVHRGAPYIERNGVPGYQPPPSMSHLFTHDSLVSRKYDEPGIAGEGKGPPADQVLWSVHNDLDSNLTAVFLGGPPLGIEAQVTLWAYDQPGPIGSVVFKRVVLINKGGVVIDGEKRALYLDSLYISQWSDPDLGDASDDLVGCDIDLRMGFAYQGRGNDRQFEQFGLGTPAIGYVLLQGPVIEGEPSDSAFSGFSILSGKKNLGFHSFAWQPSPSNVADPPGSPYTRGLQALNMMRGHTPTGLFYSHPPGVEPGLFPLSGDPTGGMGFIDGLGTAYSYTPGDRRFFMNTGPFTFAPGDTQEVLIALVGGLSGDRLSSIAVMKSNARAARQAHRVHFDFPRPPASPNVTVVELDGQVILEWSSDHERVRQTEEGVIAKEYAFEGYNVYQLPTATSGIGEGVRIATFDVDNGVRGIVEDRFDHQTGHVISQVVQRGSDSGVRRFIQITRNHLSETPVHSFLPNGREHYFAVTAYNFSPYAGTVQRTFESKPQILRATPRIPFGIRLPTAFGDTLNTVHSSGTSDLRIHPIVVNPAAGTGKGYELRFLTGVGKPRWSLRHAGSTMDLVTPQPLDTGVTTSLLIEQGFAITFNNPAPGLNRWSAEGTRPVTWVGATDLQFEGFEGAAGWASPYTRFGEGLEEPVRGNELRSIEVRFARTSDDKGTFDLSDPRASFGYRYGSGFDSSPARQEFAPFIVNTEPGYAYQDFTLSIPLSVYDIDSTPPRRLAVGYLESNTPNGLVDSRYWPPVGSRTNNTALEGPREWLFIYDIDYSTTPRSEIQRDPLATPMRIMYWATWSRRSDSPWPENASLFLFPVKAPSNSDLFTFQFPAPESGKEFEKLSARTAGVFPNPYLGGLNSSGLTLIRRVTFNNLPVRATIRILNLAGHLVRTLEKDHPSQFAFWDLTNEHGWLVSSGIYICYVEMPDVGEIKILKLAVVQSQTIPGQ